MPSKNVEQIKIWKAAHEWLAKVSAELKARGQSSASMTYLASQAILSIPMPNGHNTQNETGYGSRSELSVAAGAEGTAPQHSSKVETI